MISVYYPTRKKTFPVVHSFPKPIAQQVTTKYPSWWEAPKYVAKAATRAANMNPPIPTEEWIRRDRLIFDEYTANKFRVGDRVVPDHPREFEKRGLCIVTGVAKSYDDMDQDKWDEKKDAPMIISAQTIPEGNDNSVYRFICTPAYLTKDINKHTIPDNAAND